MIKLPSKRVWITLGVIELVLFIIATVAYAATSSGSSAGYEFILPIGFAFLVLLGTIVYSLVFVGSSLLSNKQTSNDKKGTLRRLVIVVSIVITVSLILHGLDLLIDM